MTKYQSVAPIRRYPYQSYNALTEITGKEGPWQLVNYWSHVRRRFIKRFESDGSPIAEEMLRQIALLYQIEKTVRGNGPGDRLVARREHAAPIIVALIHGTQRT
ncbi:transposase [Phaeovulum sp. NW3]|uniref:IS66 family transposase n=1 Tax=Phaeovulum sp. NW3 TaxID=2934933 RepID=UPI002020727C|nr:transposase [Phaeovulum sp. NW3]MCL7466835.1 transposase [Phaeovulum sp. NW3]